MKLETKVPVIYFKDAARAIIKLGEAAIQNIKRVNYIVAVTTPVATAQELADMLRVRLSASRVNFRPNLEPQKILGMMSLQLDDEIARREWGWNPEYNQERMIDDFLEELRTDPNRYV